MFDCGGMAFSDEGFHASIVIVSEKIQTGPLPGAGAQADDGIGMRYPAYVTEVNQTRKATKDEPGRVGLCFYCLHAQKIQSDRGAMFYRCRLSDTDPKFPKYPRLPVFRCNGYME